MYCEECCKEKDSVYSFEAFEEYDIPSEYDFICVECAEKYLVK